MPKARVATSAEADEIRGRLRGYRDAPWANEVVAKLIGSKRASHALAELHLNDRQLSKLLRSSVQAVENARSFKIRLAKESAALRRLPHLDKSVSDLQEFLKQVILPPSDILSTSISISQEDEIRLRHALRGIKQLIDDRRRIALQTVARIGATRNQSIKEAGPNAGIGWLAYSIKEITKRPHIRQACTLAETLFGIKEVTEDRLRGALRNFTERDWRSQG